MTEHRSTRPSPVLTACIVLGVVGGFWAGKVVFILATWFSTSEDMVKAFTDPMVADGIERGDAEMIYRVYLGILALLAASVVVFAVYAAMGHAVSRIMVTIAAPMMALVGMADGTLAELPLGVLAVWSIALLWSVEARRWFAQVSGKEQPVPAAPPGWPPPLPPAPHGTQQSVPQHQPPTGPPHHLPPPGAPYPQAYARPPRPPADAVKILSLITLIVSSVVAAGCGFFLVLYEFAREELVKEQLDSGMNWMDLSEAEVRDSYRDLATLSWVVLPLCLVAIVVSLVLLVRRRRQP